MRKQLPELAGGWLLDSYVIGADNDQLEYLFQSSSVRRLGSLSPVLFYGEKSLGKTSLAITLAARWSRLLQERPVCFMTGDNFCKQYASAVEIDDLASFRKKILSAKMLVVDDCEPFRNKPAAQLELAATLDNLLANAHPIILTVSTLPLASNSFLPALSSRFFGGLSIQLKKPDSTARSVLIYKLIDKINPKLPFTELISLADDLSSDQPLTLSQLANLVQLANQQFHASNALDLFLIRMLMLQLVNDQSPDVSSIAKSVGKRLSVKLSDMRGDNRSSNIVRARGLAILLVRKFTVLSLQQIGHYFGGRDHSTILHAIRKTSSLVTSDPELANVCRDLEAELLSR